MIIKTKRIYDIPSTRDGFRILVDRLWSRGITKERAALDYWYKDIAPSPDLRKWFAHKPENFTEFSKMYTEELKSKCEMVKEIKELAAQKPVTLLYAAKDPKINHAVVLRDFVTHFNC
jgi:uncharacterized protein YeaO (DUF488 family)